MFEGPIPAVEAVLDYGRLSRPKSIRIDIGHHDYDRLVFIADNQHCSLDTLMRGMIIKVTGELMCQLELEGGDPE